MIPPWLAWGSLQCLLCLCSAQWEGILPLGSISKAVLWCPEQITSWQHRAIQKQLMLWQQGLVKCLQTSDTSDETVYQLIRQRTKGQGLSLPSATHFFESFISGAWPKCTTSQGTVSNKAAILLWANMCPESCSSLGTMAGVWRAQGCHAHSYWQYNLPGLNSLSCLPCSTHEGRHAHCLWKRTPSKQSKLLMGKSSEALPWNISTCVLCTNTPLVPWLRHLSHQHHCYPSGNGKRPAAAHYIGNPRTELLTRVWVLCRENQETYWEHSTPEVPLLLCNRTKNCIIHQRSYWGITIIYSKENNCGKLWFCYRWNKRHPVCKVSLPQRAANSSGLA